MNINMKKYLLMLVSVFTAFVFTQYAGGNIFLGNSPRVNPNYLANLQNQFKQNVDNVSLAFSKMKKTNDSGVTNNSDVANNSTTSKTYSFNPAPPDNFFQSISKGVSAYDKGNGEIIFKIDDKETSVKVREIQVNGKNVKVIDLTGK